VCSFSKLQFQEYTSLLYQWHWYLGSLTLTFYPWQAYSEIPAFMQMAILKHQVSSTSSMPMASLQALPSSHLIISLHLGLSLLSASQSLHPTHWDCKFSLELRIPSQSFNSCHSTLATTNAPPSLIEKVMQDFVWGLNALQHFFHECFYRLNSLLSNFHSNLCKDFPFPLVSICLTSPHHLTASSFTEIIKIFWSGLFFTFPYLRIDYLNTLSLPSHLGLEKVWPRTFSN